MAGQEQHSTAAAEQHTETLWQRLRHNRQQNTHLFTEAGIRPELADKVICPTCGNEESVLFWSLIRRKGKKLYLQCPVCEESQIRFSLATKHAMDPVFTRGSVGGGVGTLTVLMTVSALFYFRDTPPVQLLVQELGLARESVAEQVSEWTDSRSSGSSRGSRRESPRPATPAPAAAPSAAGQEVRNPASVYFSRGDRRADLDLYAARIIERHGEREARRLLSLEYHPELNYTRVVVDSESAAWRRRLTWMGGWRQVAE
jgi:ribosomal protein S27E